jgi:hypothetical protein
MHTCENHHSPWEMNGSWTTLVVFSTYMSPSPYQPFSLGVNIMAHH